MMPTVLLVDDPVRQVGCRETLTILQNCVLLTPISDFFAAKLFRMVCKQDQKLKKTKTKAIRTAHHHHHQFIFRQSHITRRAYSKPQTEQYNTIQYNTIQ